MFTQRTVSGVYLFIQRAFSIFVFGLVVVAVVSAPAEAATKRVYAGIVVDAKTGKTLYSRQADSPRYPASVTKVMTLYVLFQELDAGRLKLSTKMKVSRHAANAVPTKLGLMPGETITAENAIKALVTQSANDIARVIAEHISGSEEKFAKRMTKTARALGMPKTTYRNASGLPDSKQITTVRDQARLGVAVYQHFPKYYEYFQISRFKYRGKTYKNHNGLLGKNGVDGIKTGYIRASGYNLLTAARKNKRHVVVVGFGFNSSGARNSKVATLINTYMPKARRGSYTAQAKIARPGLSGTIRVAAVPVTPMPRPVGRSVPNTLAPIAIASKPMIVLANAPAPENRPLSVVPANATEATNLLATGSASPVPATRPNPINIVGAWMSDTLRLDGTSAGSKPPLPPVAVGRGGKVIDLLTSGSTGADKSGSWILQVGAAHSQDDAEILISNAATKIDTLANFRPFIERVEKNGQVFYRARYAGFGDRAQALGLCDRLKQQQVSCLAMQS